MHDQIVAASQRQLDALQRFVADSDAFSEKEGIELVRWFLWRTQRLLEVDLAAFRGLEALEVERGLPFAARWADVAEAGDAPYAKLGTAFNRLEHAGIVERLGRNRQNRTTWRLLRPPVESDDAIADLSADLEAWNRDAEAA
jgi:hypothetical protein